MSLGASHSYRTVGRYRVYSELASGGMATVHLGCLRGAAGFSKLVAIKCLHQEFAAEESFVAMFLDEARLASSIHHPNVVASLDVVAEQGELLVVMEYVHGETFAGLLRTARQTGELAPVSVVAKVVCDALDGLHAAHTASLAGTLLNIVHRDVSPQNIMVGVDGNARVLDFGIAQAALRSHVTAAGTVKGKVAYMSPEQARGQHVDARTDVFAAGVVLWEALTGRRLFFAPDSRNAMELLLLSEVPAPSTIVPSLPPALDAVVLRALERDRERRFASAREFAEALRGVVTEGSRKDVADWVQRLAKDGLALRLELLQALEASAMNKTDAALPKVAPSAPRAAPVPTSPEQTQAQVTVTTSLLPGQQRSRTSSHRKVAAWVAAGGVAIALGAWFVREAPVPYAPPPGVAAAPAAPPAPPPQASFKPLEVDSAEAPPVVVAEQLPLAPTSAPKVTPKKPSVREAAVVGAPKKNCSPPYRIDAAGVRRVKPECL